MGVAQINGSRCPRASYLGGEDGCVLRQSEILDDVLRHKGAAQAVQAADYIFYWPVRAVHPLEGIGGGTALELRGYNGLVRSASQADQQPQPKIYARMVERST